MAKLGRSFYLNDTATVARQLLGKLLVSEARGKRVSGIIVETEAYLGIDDRAAHSFGGRKTRRNEAMYALGGHAYVYFIYGMYFCFNAVTGQEGVPEAVLIRALEPVEGLDFMAAERFNTDYAKLSSRQKINLTNGPGKLCMALSIDRSLNGEDLCGDKLYIEDRPVSPEVCSGKRIGIDYAGEDRDLPLRFYIKNNRFVSK
ncbi:MAG: DNA-3-methyladenine glycosylase [Firmicutes bacterium]|nr:DNA-3-methyladenine glycosylase [Bacillota bacterium]